MSATTFFWVDIENAEGKKVGTGPLRPISFNHKRLLSKSGEFTFDVYASDANILSLQEKLIAICRYVDTDGVVRIKGGGVIDSIEKSVSADGALTFTVSGNDLATELTYRTVKLKMSSSSGGILDAPTKIMQYAPLGWTILNGTTAAEVYGGFDDETVLGALVKTGEHIGEHWRLEDGRVINWLGPSESFSSSGIRAIQQVSDPIAFEQSTSTVIIESLKEVMDSSEVVSRVIPRGAGNGDAALTLASSSDSAPAGYTMDKANNWIRRDATETQYGRIEKALEFKEVAPLENTSGDIQSSANFLLQAAVEYLDRHSGPSKVYEVELMSSNVALKPGTRIRVVYRQLRDGVVLYDLNGDFNVLSVSTMIDALGIHTIGVEVSVQDRAQASDTELIASSIQSARVASVHSQLGPSVDNLRWRDEFDQDHSSSFMFWLGKEYVIIQRALLRFKVSPLRSTIKSIGVPSVTSGTESVGHSHGIQVSNGTIVDALGFGGGLGGLVTPGGGRTFRTMSNEEYHTHTIQPSVSMVYAIFEEIAANTLSVGEIQISLNNGGNLGGSVQSLSDGWYQLDITAALVDAVNRPNQESNTLKFSTLVNKTCRIEAQLTVRAVVQAIALTS